MYSVLYREVKCTVSFIERLMYNVLYREVKCTMSFIERLNVQCPL